MAVKCSRQALFFKLFLFAGLVTCTNWAGEHDIVVPLVELPPLPHQPDQPDQTVQPFQDSSSGCQSICTMSVSSVNLYYWPREHMNTACLSTVPSPPTPTIPPELNISTSTVYVLFVSLTILNGCGSTLAKYATSTASIPQNQLSSIDAKGEAQRYNLEHLPCPPAHISVPPGRPYHPKLAWVGQFYEFADPAIAKECATIRGLTGFQDPPTAVPTALGGLKGPGEAGAGHALKREPADTPAAPSMPAKTPTGT